MENCKSIQSLRQKISLEMFTVLDFCIIFGPKISGQIMDSTSLNFEKNKKRDK